MYNFKIDQQDIYKEDNYITIINSEISNNYCGGDGAGIYISVTSSTILTNVEINDNTSYSSAGIHLNNLNGRGPVKFNNVNYLFIRE